MNFILFLIIIQNICIFVTSTPKPVQKSLVLVFDTTGSMSNVLAQLRQSGIEISKKLMLDNENPFNNFFFLPFGDTVIGPAVNIQHKNDLLNSLKVIAGSLQSDDSPELSMLGMIHIISEILPKSYVFALSSTSAKDSYKVYEVILFIQEKQATETFLVTGLLKDKTSNKQISNKITSNSNGHVFNLNEDSFKIVFKYVKSILDARNQILFYTSSPIAGSGVINVNADCTMDQISVFMFGESPKFKIIDPNGTIFDKAEIALELDNILTVVVKDPAVGLWIFNYSSESAYIVKANVLSDLKFEYGFSNTIAKSKVETSTTALPSGNILTIFPSDPSLVKDLTEIKITTYDVKPSVEIFEFSLPLTKYDTFGEVFFNTELINISNIKFKLNLLGYDNKGNIINRLVLPFIQPLEGLLTDNIFPDVKTEPQRLHIIESEGIFLTCYVTSMTNIKTEWKKNGITLASNSTSFGTELKLNITASSLADAGLYECISKNQYGQKTVTIKVEIEKLEFSVKIPEAKYVVLAGAELVIPCFVDTTRDYEILWSRNNISLTSWTKGNETTKIYKESNINKNSSGVYSCHVKIFKKFKVDATNVIVNYEPIIIEKSVETKFFHFGDSIKLECNADAMPKPRIVWTFSPKTNPNAVNNIASSNIMEIKTLSRNSVGDYVCEVDNGIGTKQQRIITITATPANSPNIIKAASTEVIVNLGATFELECKCDNCSPLKDYFWKINGRFRHIEGKRIDIMNSFKNATVIYQLRVENVENDGQYECELSNDLGKDKITYNIIINYPLSNITRNTMKTFIGKTLKLNCTMERTAKHSWYKNGVLLNESSNELILNNIQRDDDGEYTCYYLNSAVVIHYVDVLYHPNILKTNDNLEVQSSTNFSLECTAEGNDLPMLMWKTNNHILLTTLKVQNNDHFMNMLKSNKTLYLNDHSSGYSVVDFENFTNTNLYTGIVTVNWKKQQISLFLNIKNMTKAWLKEMSCVAINTIGFAEKAIHSSNLLYPEFMVLKEENNPKKIEVLRGMSLKLKCFSKGIPKPETEWFKDRRVIISNITNTTQFLYKNQQLEIFSALETDSGNYTCVAKNKLGLISYNFHVNILYPPTEMNNGFIQRTQNKNDNLELNCYTASNPPAEYTWSVLNQVNGYEIAQNNTLPVLKIINIPSTTWFKCVAQNKAGLVETTFQVNVNEPLQILNNYDETIQLEYDSSIAMKCNISKSNKNVTIRWLKDGSLVTLTNVLFLNNNETLYVFSVNKLNNGTYTCLVENNLEKTQKMFKVIVKEPKRPWSNWTPYTECSSSCGSGLKVRFRFCTLPSDEIEWCIGDSTEITDCQNEPCPVHGG